MKHSALWLITALALAGCGPLGLYYKEGVSVQSAKDSETTCKIAAAQDVPVRNVTRVIPGRHIPPRRICDAKNNCVVKGGVFLPPEFITEDANASLRKDAADICMRKKGFVFTRLPACKESVKSATAPAVTTRLPKLTPKACVIHNQGGTWQIVTP
jgi:hypothetical protein